MTIFDHFFNQSLHNRDEKEILRTLCPIEVVSPVIIKHDGEDYLNFSSNDYLGLSFYPKLEQKSIEWTEKYGSGCASSRLVTGNAFFQQQLEEDLALFLGTEAALLFASGWQANVAVISCLLENLPKPVWVISDKLNHASLHYGCKAGQTKQIRYRHNDMTHLEERLEAIKSEPGSRLIITETIFSMDGDQADLERLRELSDQYNAFLYLDDAHATGVLGSKGQGLAAPYADLVMGTFSKAWGSFGAYIAGSKALCNWLVNYCSGFIHTTALPPSICGSISAALDLMPTLDMERQRLMEHDEFVVKRLKGWGVNVGHSVSQIIPIIFGSSDTTLRASSFLKEQKIWTTAIRPPTVPVNSSRIRLTLSAYHSREDIEYLLSALHMLFKK